MPDTPALPPLPDLSLFDGHTEGPWMVDEDDRPGMEWNRHIVLQEAPDNRIAFMAHGKDDGKNEANAALIAAAPALLAHVRALQAENEALKRVLADLNNFHRHKFSEAVAAAEDALFKACSYNATARAALAASRRKG